MILPFETYQPIWKEQFEIIKFDLEILLRSVQVSIEHIGSTSIEGLSAKPIIDIIIGLENEYDLDHIPPLLQGNNYVYYEKYNEDMPYRRFFVLLKKSYEELELPFCIKQGEEIPIKLHDHHLRKAHIHIVAVKSKHWLRHIAFREYLRTFPSIKQKYQELKEELVQRQWKDGNEYNEGKDTFLKKTEKFAVEWYLNKCNQEKRN